MLHDPRLHTELHRRISQGLQSAAYAVSQVLHRYASDLRRLDNSLLAERAEDVLDIEQQLLRQLGAVSRRPLSDLTEPVIVLSHNLTPSETASLDRRYGARASAPKPAALVATRRSWQKVWSYPRSLVSANS